MRGIMLCMRVAFAVGTALWGMAAYAQVAYPVKSVRVIVPFPSGGTNDIVADYEKFAKIFKIIGTPSGS